MNKTLEYHLDFEFVEGQNQAGYGVVMPLSIGIKCEDGRSLYKVYNYTHRFKQIAKEFELEGNEIDWFNNNVLNQIFNKADRDLGHCVPHIWNAVHDFFNVPNTKAQIITYWGAYDWFLLCQLYSGMMRLPDFIKPQPIDIYQSAFEAGIEIPERLRKWDNEHHALADAIAQEKIWNYVKNVKKGLR